MPAVLSGSDREKPVFTGANGTLIARPLGLNRIDGPSDLPLSGPDISQVHGPSPLDVL